MIIHERTVIDIESGAVLEDKQLSHDGPVALLKGGKSQPTTSTSTTSTALPAWLQPYAEQFIQSYQGQVFDPSGQLQTQNLPQQQVTGFTPDQLAAMDQIRNTSGGAQQLANQGAGTLSQTLSGTYMNPASNPYLRDTYDLAARSSAQTFQNAVLPGLQAQAQRAGQFGSSANNEQIQGAMNNFQQGLNDLGTQIYGGNYQQERGRQLQAQQLIPQTMSSLYAPSYQLMGIGAQQQNLGQQYADVNYANQIAAREAPFSLLSGFGGALGQAGMGAGQSTTNMTGSAPAAGGK